MGTIPHPRTVVGMETLTAPGAMTPAALAAFLAATPALDLDTLAVFAAELAQRVALLASLPAEPGDTAASYLEHRAEALELLDVIGAGLHAMGVPA